MDNTLIFELPPNGDQAAERNDFERKHPDYVFDRWVVAPGTDDKPGTIIGVGYRKQNATFYEYV